MSVCVLQEVINYRAVGEGSALAFFRIDQSGNVYVIESLLSESVSTYYVSNIFIGGGGPFTMFKLMYVFKDATYLDFLGIVTPSFVILLVGVSDFHGKSKLSISFSFISKRPDQQ